MLRSNAPLSFLQHMHGLFLLRLLPTAHLYFWLSSLFRLFSIHCNSTDGNHINKKSSRNSRWLQYLPFIVFTILSQCFLQKVILKFSHNLVLTFSTLLYTFNKYLKWSRNQFRHSFSNFICFFVLSNYYEYCYRTHSQ